MSPKPYVRPISRTSWYMRHNRYKRYIAREVTCFFIGAYTIIVTIGLWRLADGQEAFNAFITALQEPWSILFHSIILAFSLYHSVTWFNVTPQAMPLMKGEDFVPGVLIVRAHYVAWMLVSLIILIAVGV